MNDKTMKKFELKNIKKNILARNLKPQMANEITLKVEKAFPFNEKWLHVIIVQMLVEAFSCKCSL